MNILNLGNLGDHDILTINLDRSNLPKVANSDDANKGFDAFLSSKLSEDGAKEVQSREVRSKEFSSKEGQNKEDQNLSSFGGKSGFDFSNEFGFLEIKGKKLNLYSDVAFRNLTKDNLRKDTANINGVGNPGISRDRGISFKLNDGNGDMLRFYDFIVNLLSNVSKNFDIPRDLREKIDNIRSSVSSGRLDIYLVLEIISELKKLGNLSVESRNHIISLEREINEIARNFSPKAGKDVFQDITKNESFENVILNDFRINDKKQSKDTDNNIQVLQTPFKLDSKTSNFASQQVSYSGYNNFFVQFKTIGNAISELSGRIVINLRNNSNEMKMTLFPPELGKLFVKFETGNDGKLSGSIVVSTKEAYTLFQEHLNVIKDNLVSHGINVDNINLYLNNENSGGYFGNKHKENPIFESEILPRSRGSLESKDVRNYGLIDRHDGAISLYA
ncbi:MAG: flagellar hook-length control protein FliK [Brevinematia bacterium]